MNGEDYFLLYCLFALTTAFCALYELIHPAIKSMLDKGVEFPSPLWMYYVIAFILSLLTAPIIFLTCIIPSWSISFRFELEDSLVEKQE